MLGIERRILGPVQWLAAPRWRSKMTRIVRVEPLLGRVWISKMMIQKYLPFFKSLAKARNNHCGWGERRAMKITVNSTLSFCQEENIDYPVG